MGAQNEELFVFLVGAGGEEAMKIESLTSTLNIIWIHPNFAVSLDLGKTIKATKLAEYLILAINESNKDDLPAIALTHSYMLTFLWAVEQGFAAVPTNYDPADTDIVYNTINIICTFDVSSSSKQPPTLTISPKGSSDSYDSSRDSDSSLPNPPRFPTTNQNGQGVPPHQDTPSTVSHHNRGRHRSCNEDRNFRGKRSPSSSRSASSGYPLAVLLPRADQAPRYQLPSPNPLVTISEDTNPPIAHIQNKMNLLLPSSKIWQ